MSEAVNGRPKLSFRFRPRTSDQLDAIVEETDMRKGEVVEEAILALAALRDLAKEGNRLAYVDPEGQTILLVMPTISALDVDVVPVNETLVEQA